MRSSLITRFATKDPALCAVCRRHAWAVGYHHGGQRAPIVWLCDHGGCHAAARKIYAMPQQILDAYECGAALEAGDAAGRYLDEIGITDLARLDRDQWREFLRLIITGFEQAMRRKILNNEAPF
jgi:Family of unknown function (DUF6511)